VFLDDWDVDQKDEKESRTNVEKRESHIRRIHTTVRKHEKKQARPERLSELSCRSNSKKSLASTSSFGDEQERTGESDRVLKVAQVKQTLRMRADLPLIPLYSWPQCRPGDDNEEMHVPHHCEQRKDRERKHWVQEAAEDWVFMGHFKELGQDEVHRSTGKIVMYSPSTSRKKLAPVEPSFAQRTRAYRIGNTIKPTLDDLLQLSLLKKGCSRLALSGLLPSRIPRLPTVPQLKPAIGLNTSR